MLANKGLTIQTSNTIKDVANDRHISPEVMGILAQKTRKMCSLLKHIIDYADSFKVSFHSTSTPNCMGMVGIALGEWSSQDEASTTSHEGSAMADPLASVLIFLPLVWSP